MASALEEFYGQVEMTNTQFIGILDKLRNLHREGLAQDFLDPDAIPVGTAEAPLNAAQQREADVRHALVDAFGVFTEQGIFAPIEGAQKVRAQKLYRVKRATGMLNNGGV